MHIIYCQLFQHLLVVLLFILLTLECIYRDKAASTIFFIRSKEALYILLIMNQEGSMSTLHVDIGSRPSLGKYSPFKQSGPLAQHFTATIGAHAFLCLCVECF